MIDLTCLSLGRFVSIKLSFGVSEPYRGTVPTIVIENLGFFVCG